MRKESKKLKFEHLMPDEEKNGTVEVGEEDASG